MPSAASAAQREAKRLASLVFFLDHQIGRYVVAEALRAAGARVEVHLEHFPGDMRDANSRGGTFTKLFQVPRVHPCLPPLFHDRGVYPN